MGIGLALHAPPDIAVSTGALSVAVDEVARVAVASFGYAGAEMAELRGCARRIGGAGGVNLAGYRDKQHGGQQE